MTAQPSLFEIVPREFVMDYDKGRIHVTPRERGQAGASDADKHLRDHMPGWVQERLGDAFLGQRGKDFTSDDVRRLAGPTVEAWLTDKNWLERQNCFSGWFTMRRKKFKLVRVGSTPTTRDEGRGRWIGVWRFPA